MRSEHDRLLRDAVAAHGGEEVDTQGDSFLFSFRRGTDAVAAAADAQRALTGHPWPEGSPLRVRMGLHTGEPVVGEDGRYVGLALHRAARISAAAHGGQVLLSSTTADLVSDSLPEGVSLRELGRRALKDFEHPERISQLVIDGLPSDFRPVRTEDDRRRRTRALLAAAAVIVAAGVAAGTAVLSTGGSGTPKPVAVVANSVAVIDPHTNRVVADVGVGTTPAVVAGREGVWTMNIDDGTVSQIDPKTYVASTHAFANAISGIATGFGSVWASNPLDGTVSPINPGYRSAGEPIKVSSPTTPLGGTAYGLNGSPGPIAIGFGSLWVGVDGIPAELVRVNPANGALLARIPDVYTSAGRDSAGEIAIGTDVVWVSSTGDSSVLRVDPDLDIVLGRTPVGSPAGGELRVPGAIAVGNGGVWVTVQGENAVWRLDPVSGAHSGTIAVGRSPTGIAVGEGSVWVANQFAGTVSRIDPKTNRVIATIRVGHSPASVAVGYGRVWVAVRA